MCALLVERQNTQRKGESQYGSGDWAKISFDALMSACVRAATEFASAQLSALAHETAGRADRPVEGDFDDWKHVEVMRGAVASQVLGRQRFVNTVTIHRLGPALCEEDRGEDSSQFVLLSHDKPVELYTVDTRFARPLDNFDTHVNADP